MSPSAEPQQSHHFFRNYNRVVGTAYAAIVLGLFLVFAYQLNEKVAEEVAVVQGYVDRHAQFIEFVLRSSTDQLETLRMTTVDAAASQPDSTLAVLLKTTSKSDGFNMDSAPDRDVGANLVGTGILAGRELAFQTDIKVGLSLFPGLRALAFNLPSAAQAGYISANNFAVTAPWISSVDRPFEPAVYVSPVWKIGRESAKTDRSKYWAPTYFANKSQGLLVPAAAPVFQSDRFAGIVAIDTSLDYLNRINSDFGYPLGVAFLVDAYGKVLAHPKLYANPLAVEAAPDLLAALPPELAEFDKKIMALPQGKPQKINGQFVVRHGFVSAPWQLVYSVPTLAIWRKLMVERGVVMAAVLLGLSLMMLVTYIVTSREFVGPAAKLVAHLAAESRFVPTNIPAVPSAWRPWFETVSKVFRESMQLIGLRQELDIAAKMQTAILPRRWPQDPAFTLWGTMRSAKEVGGDFYDHFHIADGRLGMVVADVSGKGVPAALFGMVSKTLLRAIAMRGSTDPSSAIREVNEGLCEDNENCMFVTTFYAAFDSSSGQLTYVNAGHPLPLVVRSDGSASYLPGTAGLALGVMEGVDFNRASVTLQKGDLLLMFTSQEYGTERLLELFNKPGTLPPSPQAAVEEMIRSVDAFAGSAEQSDDITCIALQYQGQPGGAA
jgi:phosphoserine phosphatase RsbU/P